MPSVKKARSGRPVEEASTRISFAIVLHPAEEGGYWATVKGVPGCYLQGDTKREAIRNIREALACHLEALAARPAKSAAPGDAKPATPTGRGRS